MTIDVVRDIGTDAMLASARNCTCAVCMPDIAEARGAVASIGERCAASAPPPAPAPGGPLVQLRRGVWGLGPITQWHSQYLSTLADMRQYVLDGPGIRKFYEDQYLALCDKWQDRPVWTVDGYRARMGKVEDLVTEHCEINGGTNCVEGTNDFLIAFDFEPIDPCATDDGCGDSDCDNCNPEATHTFVATIRVTLTVDGRRDDDMSSLMYALESGLDVDTSSIMEEVDAESPSIEIRHDGTDY